MITILGGGIAGMLAAYAFTEYEPRLYESTLQLGGNFLAGGLKYLHDTPAMRKLLADLGVSFEPRRPEGRIHHFGELRYHPDYMASLDAGTRRGIQVAHWRKTRQTEPDESVTRSMNDPMGNHAALDCDLTLFVQRLEQWTHANSDVRLGDPIIEVRKTNAEGAMITVKDSYGDRSVFSERVITTIPLAVLAKVMDGIPTGKVSRLLLVRFAIPMFHQTRRWDYVYTPDETLITRLYWDTNEIVAEVPTSLLEVESWRLDPPTTDMIDEITAQARKVTGIPLCPLGTKLAPGHLRPLDSPLVLPPGVVALGRFAAWDSRATADKVLGQALDLKRTWYGPQSPVE